MSQKFVRAALFTVAMSGFGGFCQSANATDPFAGDSLGAPPNVNIGLIYNQFSDSGTFAPANGGNISHHTKFTDNVTIFRYIRTFDIDGYTAGVQAILPYAAFLSTELGGANLSAQSGFAQPIFALEAYPINENAKGRSAFTAFYYSPPVSSANKNDQVNGSENLASYEVEVGFHQILFGNPTGVNLALEGWNEAYVYSSNSQWTYGPAASTYRQQPTDEIRVYLPYVINAADGLSVAPGLFQSFGGKQTEALHGTSEIVDTGNRTSITELRFQGSIFVSPTTQILGIGEYDVAGHSGFLNRSIELRLLKFF